jgi:hypothetical protein
MTYAVPCTVERRGSNLINSGHVCVCGSVDQEEWCCDLVVGGGVLLNRKC